MGYKTISLSDKAYKMLSSLKREGESFTDVIIRLCSNVAKKPLTNFAGTWEMSDEEEKRIFNEISSLWKEYEESLFGYGFSNSIIKREVRSS